MVRRIVIAAGLLFAGLAGLIAWAGPGPETVRVIAVRPEAVPVAAPAFGRAPAVPQAIPACGGDAAMKARGPAKAPTDT